jgi:hypothetical protein
MNDYCKQLFESDFVNFYECAAEEEAQQGDVDDAYSWYSYDLENADEIEQACAKVVSFNGKYTNYYDSATSGSVHRRDWKGSLVTNASTGLSGGAITAIVLVCVNVVALVARLLVGKAKKETVNVPALEEPMYPGGRLS